MTLSWEQSGAIDNYIVTYNNTVTSSVNFTSVSNVSVSMTVSDLPTPGAYYCISVTAVSGHLHSDSVVLCNYTGTRFANILTFSAVRKVCCDLYKKWIVNGITEN